MGLVPGSGTRLRGPFRVEEYEMQEIPQKRWMHPQGGHPRLILSQKVCAGRIRTNVPTPGYDIQSLFRVLPQHTVALTCAKALELPQNGFLRGNHGYTIRLATCIAARPIKPQCGHVCLVLSDVPKEIQRNRGADWVLTKGRQAYGGTFRTQPTSVPSWRGQRLIHRRERMTGEQPRRRHLVSGVR